MTDTPDRDPCEDLAQVGPPPPDEGLRAAVGRRTRDVLRRKRWAKRAAVAAALAACYLAGLGTARLGTESLPNHPPPAATGGKETPDESTTATAAVSPLALEWQALDSPQPRPDLARRAGDRYAAEEGDYQSALRCYRDALDASSDNDLAIQPGDSWLLMVLKDARQKEKRDANPNE